MNRSDSLRASIICVGDELVEGRTRDSNAHWLCGELTESGIEVEQVRFVQDTIPDISSSLAAVESELVFVSGGLGPTPDDLTLDGIAHWLGVGRSVNKEALEDVERRYGERGALPLNEGQKNMAAMPEGTRVITNPIGIAPGCEAIKGGKTVFIGPGVPHEFRSMMTEQVLPRFQAEPPFVREIEASRIREHQIAMTLYRLMEQYGVQIGSYPRKGHVLLRVVGRDEQAVDQAYSKVVAKVEELHGLKGVALAREQIDLGIVQFRFDEPVTFASGIRSPIYCDSRRFIGHPRVRRSIVQGLVDLIGNYGEPDRIGGVATAGIPWASWVADRMEKPMVYIRSKPKGHGMKKMIEGEFEPGDRIAVIEDLISTGGSSVKAAKDIEEAGGKVTCVLALFSYGFDEATDAFANAGFTHATLARFEDLLPTAKERLPPEHYAILEEWRTDPKSF